MAPIAALNGSVTASPAILDFPVRKLRSTGGSSKKSTGKNGLSKTAGSSSSPVKTRKGAVLTPTKKATPLNNKKSLLVEAATALSSSPRSRSGRRALFSGNGENSDPNVESAAAEKPQPEKRPSVQQPKSNSIRKTCLEKALNSPKKSLVDQVLHSPKKSPRKDLIRKETSPLKSPNKALLAAAENSPRKVSEARNSPRKALFEAEVSPRKAPAQARSSPRKNLFGGESSPRKTLIEAANSPRCSPRKLVYEGANSPRSSPRKALFEDDERKDKATPKRLQLYRESAVPKEWTLAKKALQTGGACTDETGFFVGREKQRVVLKDFLEYNLQMRKRKGKNTTKKRSLYVSGPPGTGKTSLIRQLLTGLDGSGSNFRSAFINCMALKSSAAVFAKIAESLRCGSGGDDRKTGSSAQKRVEELISSTKEPILLVLDEIDQLDSKSQQVLYTLYEWPYLNNSMLALIGIANALDLTDRILPRLKLREAVSPGELTFAAYSREEIVKIINTRLESVSGSAAESVIKPGAVRFLAAKISALSGDVRKALDVCRRSLELAEVQVKKQALLKENSSGNGGFKPIDIPQILKIVNEVYSSSAATASLKQSNSDLPLQQKIIVASLLLMTNYGARPVKEVRLGKLHETYSKLCKKREMGAVNLSEVASMCTMLEARGFFSTRTLTSAKVTKDIRLSLRIDEDEVEAALKDKALLSGIIRDVDCIAK